MKFKGIASRIILSVVPIIALATILFIVAIHNATDTQITGAMDDKMRESLEVATIEIQKELLRNADIARSLALYAGTASVETIEKGEMQAFLLKSIPSNKNTVGGGIWFEPYTLYPNEQYFGPYVYLENGEAIYSGEYASQVDYHGTNWYHEGKRSGGEIVWSDIYYDLVARVTMITASTSFLGPDGQVLGVATADMALTDIRQIARSLTVGETGRAFILGAEGEYITYLDTSRRFNQKITEETDPEVAAFGRQALTTDHGSAMVTLEGQQLRAYYKTIEETGWVLVVTIDSDEIGSNITETVMGMAIVPLIGLIAATISIAFVAGHLRRIVNKVNGFADMAASGDFSKRIEITEHDEFGIMEERLNKMMDNMSAMSEHSAKMLEVAETANRAKSDFLSRMSHEIRTPMNAVIGMTQIARGTRDMDKAQDCLTKIDAASKHLLSLLNAILDMSQIEANKMSLVDDAFDVRRAVADVSAVLAVKMTDKSQQLTLQIEDDVPQLIVADHLRYVQVLTNLLENAGKFTPENGDITVTVRVAGGDETSCILQTSVADTGIGISQQDQQKLFQSFEQADGGASRRYGGTGLGLALCKRIVELMGGSIWVESELGKGSEFSFTLCARRVAPAQATESDSAMPGVYDFHGKTILLAEDIDINREIVEALLEDTGVKLDFAENGLRACELFRKNPGHYDLILMDLQMPEMDGLEAARTIRGMSAEGATIPILAMTANAFVEDMEKTREAGMNGHIAKPVDVAVLLAKLAECMG